ncbi:hypothetical protein K435DRAFT_857379 [Dendrothele bispora CBS 962.96]|uniref:Uncharacterized protein n=1 Tax=Dendrothele bispora (strain CBS 962.96) TaxID=1314807 RepID=A0A4S8M614_DENBC|nr:hypothetical protein K435DRAFT_857379 [Dendrothele bispora CBS 962.96]
MSDSPLLSGPLTGQLWSQVNITMYFAIGTAGMALWDFLVHLEDDFLILFKKASAIPTIAYIISRLSMVGAALMSAVFISKNRFDPFSPHHRTHRTNKKAISTTKCKAINYVMLTFLFISVSSTTLLFFLRLKALYDHNQTVIRIFFCLWLITVGCSVTMFWSGEIAHFPDPVTQDPVCIYSAFNLKRGSFPLDAVLIHDTCVFIAVSCRLYHNSYFEMALANRQNAHSDFNLHLTKTMSKTKEFISGRHLPAFSKALLRNGQIYYLISLCASVVTSLFLYIPFFSIPGMKGTPGIRIMLLVPHATIVNAMACRAFRQVRAGRRWENLVTCSIPAGTLSSQQCGGRSGMMGFDVDVDDHVSIRGDRKKGKLPTCYVHQTVDIHLDETPTSMDQAAFTSGPSRMHRRSTVSELSPPSRTLDL